MPPCAIYAVLEVKPKASFMLDDLYTNRATIPWSLNLLFKIYKKKFS